MPASRERVIDVAAKAAFEARYAGSGVEWENVTDGHRVMWRKAVLAAAGVIDRQLTSVTVMTKVRHHHSTEELEGLMEVLEREAK